MKQPRLILEWDCGGIGCTKIVQVETDAALSSLTDAALQLIAEGGGCRTLGRATFFCPTCADPKRRAPDCLR